MGRHDADRGQSIALDYVLALSVGFLLITGLVVAGSDFVSSQRERAQETELRVIGQQVAAGIGAADRMVQAEESSGNVRIERRIPGDVAGTGYTIELLARENASLRLESSGASVEVDLVNETDLETTTVQGGDIVVNETGSGTIRLEDGDPYE